MLTVKSIINIASQAAPPIITAVQGDTGRSIEFTVADFTIPEGATATYYIQKPSGNSIYNTATISGNVVTVDLTAQSLAESGDNFGQIRIMKNGEIVTSFDFILLVKAFRGIDATESTTEMNVFDQAVAAALEEIDGSLENIVAEEFDPANSYLAGEYVLKDGAFYKFTTNHTGVWSTSDVEETTIGEELTNGGGGGGAVDSVNGQTGTVVLDAGDLEYDDEETYAAGSVGAELTSLMGGLTEKYTKPSGGIPSTDMTSEVQTSLGKADSAYQKPSGGIPSTDLASGVIPSVPVQDVKLNGSSIVSNHEAVIPMGSTSVPGVLQVDNRNGTGLQILDGKLQVYPANSSDIKWGWGDYRLISAPRQHEATFYGLAKAAGDSSQASSSNTVGTYTDAAKVAIQKMLGIYEPSWELIREDTVTNATEADINITVDGDGNSYEITSAVILFETPKQDTASGKGDYGLLKFYDGSSLVAQTYNTAWTQAANANANGIWTTIEKKDNLIFVTSKAKSDNSNSGLLSQYYGAGFNNYYQAIREVTDFKITKVVITKVTGTGHYKLYGKRKSS